MAEDDVIRIGQTESGPMVTCSKHGPKQTLLQARADLPGEAWVSVGCSKCCVEALAETVDQWRNRHGIEWSRPPATVILADGVEREALFPSGLTPERVTMMEPAEATRWMRELEDRALAAEARAKRQHARAQSLWAQATAAEARVAELEAIERRLEQRAEDAEGERNLFAEQATAAEARVAEMEEVAGVWARLSGPCVQPLKPNGGRRVYRCPGCLEQCEVGLQRDFPSEAHEEECEWLALQQALIGKEKNGG